MSQPAILLRLTEISKAYPAAGPAPLTVLRSVSLDVRTGETLAVIGPSGSGKSTLLNIIGTLDHPSSGRVELEGKDLSGLDEGATARVRNREIGFIFQGHHLLPQCTVLENVLVPTLAFKETDLRDRAQARARDLLARVGLGDRLWHRPGQLSGGERQRVAVVRALINRPKILLADEPTGALDRVSAQGLGELLVALNREQGITLMVVTHWLELADRMQRVYELRDGVLSPYATAQTQVSR